MTWFKLCVHCSNVSTKDGSAGKAYKRTIVGRVAHEAEGVKFTRTSTERLSGIFYQPADEEAIYTVSVRIN